VMGIYIVGTMWYIGGTIWYIDGTILYKIYVTERVGACLFGLCGGVVTLR
jgi:hypothetical protein